MQCQCGCHKSDKLCGLCCEEALHKPSDAEDKSQKILQNAFKGKK